MVNTVALQICIDYTINVDASPHPSAAHPIQIRGGNSLEVTDAGT